METMSLSPTCEARCLIYYKKMKEVYIVLTL